MRRLPLLRFLSLLPFATAALFASDERAAAACGGCFVPPVQVDRTVVTDHRMAFAITRDKTVLWDQIKYSGDPREFAWVLPVKPGATVELSNDAWFAALDASTQPLVTSPAYYGGGYGCALTGCSSSDSTSASGADPGAGQVQIISQSVVGPYETVTLRATDPNALETWLTQHSFAIPDSIKPTIDKYVAEGFDFIALRLVPSCNERSMRPVRIVTPGADATLPLRMVAAGVGARVGITLYVIGEGRYRPQNFPEVTMDDAELEWDRAQNRSNYDEHSQSLMAQSNGHTWLTEYANHPNLYDPGVGYGYPGSTGYYSNTRNPGLAEAYFAQCRPSYGGGGAGTRTGGQPQPCTEQTIDAGTDSATTPDAGAIDAATNDAGDVDAGASDGATRDAAAIDSGANEDAGTASTDSGVPHYDAGANDACAGFDDLDVALGSLHHNDVWVTRLRAVLPTDALKIGDLRLEAAPHQDYVSNFHQTTRYTDETGRARSGCASATGKHQPFSAYVVVGVAALALGGMIRRRVRR